MNLLIITDDEKLHTKLRALATKAALHLPLAVTPEEAIASVERAEFLQSSAAYIFLDLNAVSFDAFALCQRLKERAPDARVIASSLGVDVAIVQRAKLAGVEQVLPRYKFEELLRSVVAMMQAQSVS